MYSTPSSCSARTTISAPDNISTVATSKNKHAFNPRVKPVERGVIGKSSPVGEPRTWGSSGVCVEVANGRHRVRMSSEVAARGSSPANQKQKPPEVPSAGRECSVILLTGHRGNDAPGPGHTFTGKRMRVPISGKSRFCQKCATNQSPWSGLACRKTPSRVMLKSYRNRQAIRRPIP